MTSATATDSSGNSNNGTLMNGPTKVIGKIGQGISFDGVDDYITAPSISAYNTAGNFSVSVWIKPPNQNQNSGTILNQRLGSSPFTQWALYIGGTDCINGSTGKKIQIDLLENNTTLLRCLYTTNDIVDGKWHHLVLVSNRTNATTTLYVDGVSTSLTTFTSVGAYPNTDTSQPIVMGQNNGGSNYYTGLMDDVKYYNRAISAKEVLALYKAGGGVVIASVSNTKANTNSTGISDGLIGHWTFDGKNMTSTTAIDSSGNGNTGTLTNMTASSSAITGKIGQGLLFNGSSYISFLHTATLNAYPISFGGWFKTTRRAGAGAADRAHHWHPDPREDGAEAVQDRDGGAEAV